MSIISSLWKNIKNFFSVFALSAMHVCVRVCVQVPVCSGTMVLKLSVTSGLVSFFLQHFPAINPALINPYLLMIHRAPHANAPQFIELSPSLAWTLFLVFLLFQIMLKQLVSKPPNDPLRAGSWKLQRSQVLQLPILPLPCRPFSL